MDITNVRLHILETQGSIKAYADIVIDDEFIVKGLAIREDAKDHYLFVTMPFKINPNEPDKKKSRIDVAHPLNEDTRRYIEDKVIDAYEDELNRKP